jgi:transcriptional regulator with XRE-family HTH domain
MVETSRSPHDPTIGRAPVRAQGPTALRIVVGSQLRRLREARGITAATAGHAIRASPAKISRMELGRVGVKERDVADLLTLYGVTEGHHRKSLLVLARRASTPGWWHHYSDILPSWFETYLGLEQSSTVIRCYEPHLVPGLLQIPQVTRAVIQLGSPDHPADDVERRVALRMTRQKILTQPAAPTLWAVIEEAALWRLDGHPVMRAQIQHLIEMTTLPHITLQVIPLYSGPHMAIGGPFTILRFSEPDLPDIVYLEHLTSALYLDKKTDVDHYMMVMDRLCVHAKPPTETTQFLHNTLQAL